MNIFMNCLKCFFLFLKNLKFLFCNLRMENRTIKIRVQREKCLKNTLSNQFLKVEISLFELEKEFIELNEIELKDTETEIKREMRELFFKPNNVETKIKREVGKLFFKPNNIQMI